MVPRQTAITPAAAHLNTRTNTRRSTNEIATTTRTTLRIRTASGDVIEAWVYRPEGEGPHPAIVLAHGFAAVKAGGLAPFAEQFCREGFLAIAFDRGRQRQGQQDCESVIRVLVTAAMGIEALFTVGLARGISWLRRTLAHAQPLRLAGEIGGG